jgi:hypothetical protein
VISRQTNGAQTLLIENNGAIDCLREDNSHTGASTCSCHLDGGTPQQALLLQLTEPNSVTSERIPRVQIELVRTPILSQQLTSDSTESVLIEERFIETTLTNSVPPMEFHSTAPVFSLLSLRREPLYIYNQKRKRMVLDEGIVTK